MTEDIDEQLAARDYFRLLALSESPQGRLRAPREQWSDAERTAADMIELLGLIDATQYRYDDAAVNARLALVTPEEASRYDAALRAIGEQHQRRLLGILQEKLLTPAMAVPADHRAFVIAFLRHANEPLIKMLRFAISMEQLQRGLCRHLETAAASLPSLPPHEAPHTSMVEPRAPSISLWRNPDRGRRHLFLLRENDAAALLDTWMASHPAAHRYDQGMSQPITSYTEAVQLEPKNTTHWRTLVGSLLGELQPDGAAPDFLHSRWLPGSDVPMAQLLERLAANFRWTLMRWTSFRESVLAWVSDDEECADRFAALLHQQGEAALITAYRHIDTLEHCSLGLQFAEYDADGNTDGCGEVGLVAAGGDEAAPWLVLAMHWEQGYWWRAASARLPVHAWHWTSDLNREIAIIVYRGTDADAWRELWSRLGADDNVAILAADGRIPIEVLRERLVRTKYTISIDNLRYLAGEQGWAYGHIWGGGSDEHYALFFARDPAVTARVAAFARERWPESWRWHGCW